MRIRPLPAGCLKAPRLAARQPRWQGSNSIRRTMAWKSRRAKAGKADPSRLDAFSHDPSLLPVPVHIDGFSGLGFRGKSLAATRQSSQRFPFQVHRLPLIEKLGTEPLIEVHRGSVPIQYLPS